MTQAEATVGALVKHPAYERHGVIVHADAAHIRVEYDNGHIGLLYWDRDMLPCAYALEVVAPPVAASQEEKP